MKRTILVTFFLYVTIMAFAHSDYIISSKTGNVETSITTGYNYEDINKVEITGQLINILSDNLKNKTKIAVFVRHTYTSPDFKTKYCINYKSNKIFIICYCYRVVPLELIKLAEYAISNKKKLKRMQTNEIFDTPYSKEEWPSIAESIIAQVLNAPVSSIVSNLIENKIYKPEKDGKYSLTSYYFQNNKYYITAKKHNDEVILAEYDDIFQFSVLMSENILLFDTDSTFVFYDSLAQPFEPKNRISKKHTFDNLSSWGRPYKISYMGRDRICITMSYNPSKKIKKYFDEQAASWLSSRRENNMIYLVNNDFLIEDTDDILDSIAVERIKQRIPFSKK